MVLPLGLLSPFWAWVMWLALSVGSLVLSMRLLWGMQGGPGVSRDPFLLVGYTFAPVPACLVAGQMGLLLLLGVVLFLRFQADRPVSCRCFARSPICQAASAGVVFGWFFLSGF